MAAIWSFLRSTIGLKVQMAVSGFVLFGFCAEHLIGMMLFFKGPSVINGYGSLLRLSPTVLWTLRSVIIVSALVHIWTATMLYLRQRAARPVGYHTRRWRTVSYAARTMKYSGPLVLAFVVFHIAHLTLGANVTPVPFIEGDVYANVWNSFQYGWLVWLYIIGTSLVGVHLLHGGYSMFQSIGIKHPRIDSVIRAVVGGATIILVAGFVFLPCAIFFKLVGG